jgi:MFS superfamily sulfate permease-like transporter
VGDLVTLAPSAFAIALLAFSDTVLTARSFAARNRYRIDANQELFALGAGNIVAGLTQGLPVSGSGARRAVAEAAGARGQLSALVAAGVVGVVE